MSENSETEHTQNSQRDEEVCEFYKNNSIGDTAAKFGLSVARVYQILRQKGVPKRKNPKRRQRLIDSKPLSSFHAQIGQDIAFRRMKKNMTASEFAKNANMTKERLRAIEMGVKDLTVTDICRLAKAADLSVEYLMTERTTANKSGAA